MHIKALQLLSRKTEVEFSGWVDKIAYRWANAFSLKDKAYTFVSELQAAIETVVVYKTKELDDNRRSFENVFQIAQDESEAYRACLTKPTLSRKGFYASSHRDNDEKFIMFGKTQNLVYRGPPKPVVLRKQSVMHRLWVILDARARPNFFERSSCFLFSKQKLCAYLVWSEFSLATTNFCVSSAVSICVLIFDG